MFGEYLMMDHSTLTTHLYLNATLYYIHTTFQFSCLFAEDLSFIFNEKNLNILNIVGL